MKEKMMTLTTCDFYGAMDSLDGVDPIAPGNYKIKFPKVSSSSVHKVYIEKITTREQVDMNSCPDTVVNHRAYIKEEIHGKMTKVYLCDFTGIKLLKINKKD